MRIKKRFEKDSGTFLNLAIAYADKGEHSQAKEFFEKAIENDTKSPENYFSYGSYLLEFVMKDRIWRFGLSSENIEELKKAEQLLTKAIELLKETDKDRELENAYINRSSIRAILDNLSLALDDVNTALEIDPKSHNAYANRARLNTISRNFDEAIADFKLAIQNGASKDDLIPLLISCFLKRADTRPDEAIFSIKGYYTDKEIRANIIVGALLAECYVAKENFAEANSIIKGLYEKHGRDPRVLLVESDLRKAEGNTDLFSLLSKEAIEKAKGSEKHVAELQLAKHYKGSGAYEKAIPFYESFVSEGLFDDFLKDYLTCLYKSKENRSQNIQKCLRICQNLTKGGKNIPFVLELEASIYQELDRLQEAGNLYLRLSQIEPKNSRHKLNYAATLIDVGGGKEKLGAKLLLEIKDNIVETNYLIMLAKLLARIEYYDEAIKKAYEVLEIDFNNAESQLLYVYIFFKRGDKKSPLLDSNKVKEGFFVKFKKDGQEKEYLMLDDPKASINRSEVYKDSGLGRAIYGKKVGDKIKSERDIGVSETIEILDIKSKYVKTFQSILADFNTHFPDNQALMKIEADPKKITPILKQMSEMSSKIIEMYLSKKLTIGAVSCFMNRNLFVTWGTLIAKDTLIYCASGSVAEQEKEQELVGHAKKILLEPISLFTLAYLDILGLPAKFFEEVFVTQATMDEIEMELMEQSNYGGKGYMTLFYQDDKPYRKDISSEEIKKRAEFLRKIKNYINKGFKVMGLDNPLIETLGDKQEILGRSYAYSIQTCQEKNLSLFCDDQMFKELIFNEYGIKSFGIQNFLILTVKKGLISEKEFFDKIIELAKLNYRYLSISAKMLFYAAEQSQFQLAMSENFNALIKVLGLKETSFDSLLNVMTDFMRLIYIESLPAQIKTNFLFLSLGIITQNREPQKCLKAFKIILRKKLGLVNYIMPRIEKEMSHWLKAEFPFSL